MDIQQEINEEIKRHRQIMVAYNGQMTLGRLIQALEKLMDKQKKIKEKYGHEAYIIFDFCGFYPTGIDSWRGHYSELALEYYSNDSKTHLTEFLQMLKDAVGKTFQGYKGGDFVMDEDTPIWVDNYGESHNTAVVGILDNDFEIIILTGWREF